LKDESLNTLLLRAAIAGAFAGLVTGIITLLRLDPILSLLDAMLDTGRTPIGQGTLNLARNLLRLSPLLQPINTATTTVLITIAVWLLVKPLKQRYRATLILSTTAYATLTLAATAYLSRITHTSVPLYLIGVPPAIVYTLILAVLEKLGIPSTEPAIT